MATPQYLIRQRAKELDEILARAHRSQPHGGYGGDSCNSSGLDLLAEIGKRQIEEAKKKYGRDWKKVPLKEIFES